MLIFSDVFDPDRVQIFNCGTEPNRACNIGSTSLKLKGQLVVCGLLERDRANHVSAALVWERCFKQLGLAIQHANTHRTKHLVAGERVEISIERLHINFHVGHSLSTVDQHGNVFLMCELDNFTDGINRPQCIRDMRDSDELGSGGQQLRKVIKYQLAGRSEEHTSEL